MLETLEDRLTPAAFVEPPIITSIGGVLTATLDMNAGNTVIDGSPVVNSWTYNGLYVGPTLVANPGDVLHITVNNNLPEGEITNLHTHGLHVSPIGNSDNVLLQIMPGEGNDFEIQIPADHPEGLYWYHPHHHGHVFDQISLGLSGMLVIGRPDGGASELNGLTQHVLGLKHALLAGNQLTVPVFGSDVSAQTFTVNGLVDPTLTILPNEWQVFNLANLGSNAFYTLRVVDQANPGTPIPLFTLAEDGNPFTNVRQNNQIGVPPGRRWSFTFQPPAVAGTIYLLETTGFNDGTHNWPAQTLMTFNYSGTPVAPTTPITSPTMALTPPNQNYHDLRDPGVQIAAERTVIFSNNGATQMINGNIFPNNPIFQPRLNTVEEWTLINNTSADHPFHLHVNPQQVVQAPAIPTGLPLWQDVVNVPVGATVKIRIEFVDFLGEFVYHCHRVDHEDHGMMALVDVIPEEPIYATGANAGRPPKVTVVDPVTDSPAEFLAFPPSYKGGVNVAVGDVNGDGVYDVIVGRARGEGRVKVVDGTQLDQVDPQGVILPSALLGDFQAYPSGGVFVAGGDHDGTFGDEIVTGRGRGKGPVKIFAADGTFLDDLEAFTPNWKGGVRVATGDINSDGRIDIITGKGPGGKPQVRVFHGGDLSMLADFLAFGPGFRGGVYLASGNTKGFASTDIIVGKGAGSKPEVRVFSDEPPAGHEDHDTHLHLILIDSFLAYGAGYRGGVKVTSLHDDTLLAPFGGNRDAIVTTRGQGNESPQTFLVDFAPPPPP